MVKDDQIGGGDPQPEPVHQADAEDIEHHAQHAEHAHLDHGDRMQQRADRRGRHHRRGQPGVQRHHRGLGEAEQVAEVDHGQQRRRGVDPRQQPARHEVERPRQMVGQRQRREQDALRRAHQVDEVFPRAVPGLVVLVVIDERIGDEAQDLVEDHQGEQVGGERAAGRRREAGGETGEEPGLRVLLQAAHVADGIDRRHDPEQRGDASRTPSPARRPGRRSRSPAGSRTAGIRWFRPPAPWAPSRRRSRT